MFSANSSTAYDNLAIKEHSPTLEELHQIFSLYLDNEKMFELFEAQHFINHKYINYQNKIILALPLLDME